MYKIIPNEVFQKISDSGRSSIPKKAGSTSKFKVAYTTVKKSKDGELKCLVCIDPIETNGVKGKISVTSTEIYSVNPADILFQDLHLINYRAVVDFISCPNNQVNFRYLSRKFIRSLRKIGVPLHKDSNLMEILKTKKKVAMSRS